MVAKPSLIFSIAPPTLAPRRIPEPSSTVPRGKCERSKSGACCFTISRFMTKPPAHSTTRTPRTRIACFAVDAQHKAVHVTAAVGNECQRACVIQNPHVSFDDALRQHVHDIAPAAHAEELRTVPARCRPRTLDERPRLLAPRPDQAVIRGGLDAALGNVGVLVFDALCGEPLEMLEGAVRIAARLRGIRIRAAGHQQVLIKVLRRIRKTCGALDRRAPAAAEVDLAARKRRGAPVTPGTLHQQHAGPAARGLERGTRAGGTEAEHDHITFVVPVADPLQRAPDDLMNSGATASRGLLCFGDVSAQG